MLVLFKISNEDSFLLFSCMLVFLSFLFKASNRDSSYSSTCIVLLELVLMLSLKGHNSPFLFIACACLLYLNLSLKRPHVII
jgi:hypothetical protein